ncbi:hypothetical protein MEX01_17000 [Methylorubrum extorquens]|nr:hypothetical protein MEX01_17000 [Methylorubrum extorquens]
MLVQTRGIRRVARKPADAAYDEDPEPALAGGFEHRRDTLAADRRGTGPVAVHEKQTLLVELSSERVGVGVAVRQLRRDAEIEGIRGRST